ncbi:MAG: hypothetical protein QM405_00895 [Euryarchaeota archaeon]|nr:hypothetical protein [Euryarchaeota archaeon]
MLASLSGAGMAGASAADNVTAPAPTVSYSLVPTELHQPGISLNQSLTTSNTMESNSTARMGNPGSGDELAAAGTAKTMSNTTFTLSQVKDAEPGSNTS